MDKSLCCMKMLIMYGCPLINIHFALIPYHVTERQMYTYGFQFGGKSRIEQEL